VRELVRGTATRVPGIAQVATHASPRCLFAMCG
jgi:hypothetical protein